jgi:hypothetical protein
MCHDLNTRCTTNCLMNTVSLTGEHRILLRMFALNNWISKDYTKDLRIDGSSNVIGDINLLKLKLVEITRKTSVRTAHTTLHC